MSRDGAGVSSGRGGTRLCVLVVDDEFLIADYVALLLEEAGHVVLGPAASAAEALELLRGGAAVDAAVLDIKLPGGMDGIALAAEIAQRHGPLPVVFASGSGDPTTRRRAEAAAPLAFLQKPIEPEALLRALSRAAPRARGMPEGSAVHARGTSKGIGQVTCRPTRPGPLNDPGDGVLAQFELAADQAVTAALSLAVPERDLRREVIDR